MRKILIIVFLNIFTLNVVSGYQHNLHSCLQSSYLCRNPILNKEDKILIEKAEYQHNLNNCLQSSYLCKHSILDKEDKTLVEKAEYNNKPTKENNIGSGCAENGSCYGDISVITSRPKTINVKGYYRKNGTYVRGHYRSRK